ncbi:aminoglycoside phosphotransferase family protein [Actinomadura harenae]|uniref:Aminoglycoside phosphotransferase family protein n=1 Tax=Actinomadura harenae TaxID=2483351 RepID=A0A3M2M9L6_9ACTN|nr:aminoglycoside phosphotransferase family protein [Actinomadura harenae]RMI46169.1 aminoglycoside phosphotransferase family protein [Actinomadura harenae]
MTGSDAAPMPDALRQWIAGRLPGTFVSVADKSWERDTSRVWLVETTVTTAYAKISPTVEAFWREVGAYRHAETALAPGQAPRLLAADLGLRAIISTQLPGRIVRHLDLPPAVEVGVHELAGRLLRGWHAHPAPAPAHARESFRASMTDQAAEAAACLNLLGDDLSAAARALVREVAHDLPALADSLPLVYLHGDYGTRNWLWDTEAERLAVIDFEAAAHGLAVQDMVWQCGALWTTRPDLREAFLNGFGRKPSPDENRALVLLTARLAASYLATGRTTHDQVLVDRGHRALSSLARTLH